MEYVQNLTGLVRNLGAIAKHLSELRSCVSESRGGRPGPPVPNSPYGLRGRKAIFEEDDHQSCMKDEVADLAAPRPKYHNSYGRFGLNGRSATLNV